MLILLNGVSLPLTHITDDIPSVLLPPSCNFPKASLLLIFLCSPFPALSFSDHLHRNNQRFICTELEILKVAG